jgi:hypothetical protein
MYLFSLALRQGLLQLPGQSQGLHIGTGSSS